jgi:glutathione peroxidase
MRVHLLLILVPLIAGCDHFDRFRVGPVTVPTHKNKTAPMSFHDLSATDISGNLVRMDQFAGRKVMVVNTASECGFTKQYQQLQELYEQYRDQGLVILGFPSNDFGGQEPGSESQIASFCEKNYGVTFPMMAKVNITGDKPHAVYHWLMNKEQNGVMDAPVKWNFNKFLIDEQGRLVKYLPSSADPLGEEVLDWVGK